ncbi:hypothetical protein B0O99DRAFT_634886 [Bisporella sp. PMI_857]|nr:hypothetical protein B0O99DRAFT_634886 [Bisporella sp. PMI_857]
MVDEGVRKIQVLPGPNSKKSRFIGLVDSQNQLDPQQMHEQDQKHRQNYMRHQHQAGSQNQICIQTKDSSTWMAIQATGVMNSFPPNLLPKPWERGALHMDGNSQGSSKERIFPTYPTGSFAAESLRWTASLEPVNAWDRAFMTQDPSSTVAISATELSQLPEENPSHQEINQAEPSMAQRYSFPENYLQTKEDDLGFKHSF